MRAKLIRIGNSRGVRLPKSAIAAAGLSDEVEIQVRDGAVIITPARKPREGWAEAAARAVANGDNALVWPYFENEFDRTEWEW